MKTVADILVLGEPSLGEEFARRCKAAGVGVACRDEPYDALEEMSRRPWPVVVLTAPRPEFESLTRAVRRLQPQARLLAVCSPAAEDEVRRLSPRALDDYYIYPPTRCDWQSLIQAARGPAAPGRAPQTAALTPGDISALVAAAGSIEELERHVARLVGGRGGQAVQWVDADDVPPGVLPLLVAGDEQPRALVAQQPQGPAIDPAAAPLLAALRELLPALVAAAERCQTLNRLATTDHLTGAHNRRHFYLRTDEILERAAKEGFRVTLLLYDIDDFKQYNDKFGHAAGDEILRETAALMKQISRSQDIVARIGGDEFAVLFWDPQPLRSPDSKPLKTAYDLADRFRQAVRKLKFRSLGPKAAGTLTISGGLASFPDAGRTVRELLRSADGALAAAKESGKNAIHLIGKE